MMQSPIPPPMPPSNDQSNLPIHSSEQSSDMMDTSSSNQQPERPFDGRVRACYVGQQFMLNLDQSFRHGYMVAGNIQGTQLKGVIFTSPCAAKVTAMKPNQVIEPILQRPITAPATDADVASRVPPVVEEQQPIEYQSYQTYEPSTYIEPIVEAAPKRQRKPRKSKASENSDQSPPAVPQV